MTDQNGLMNTIARSGKSDEIMIVMTITKLHNKLVVSSDDVVMSTVTPGQPIEKYLEREK